MKTYVDFSQDLVRTKRFAGSNNKKTEKFIDIEIKNKIEYY